MESPETLEDYYGRTQVMHPDWLKAGLKSNISTLELIQKGVWPEVITGAACITTALWLLRCVYGSDLESALAVRRIALGKVKRDQEWDAHRHKHPNLCGDPECFLCYEPKVRGAAGDVSAEGGRT